MAATGLMGIYILDSLRWVWHRLWGQASAFHCCGITFEPTKRIAAFSIAPPKPIPPRGKTSEEKPMRAAPKASRAIAVSGDGESGIHMPKMAVPAICIASIWTSHFAFTKMFANWIAKYKASGSLATYCTLILPGCWERCLSKSALISLGSTRQANCALSRSCSIRAWSASFIRDAVRSFASAASLSASLKIFVGDFWNWQFAELVI